MKRRQVLQGAGLSGTVALSGCLGLGTSDTENGGTPEPGAGNGNETGDETTPDSGRSQAGTAPEIDGTWPTFQGDTGSTGTGRGEATGPAGEPTVAWTVTTGDELWGDPIIVDGTVFVGTHQTVTALDIESGGPISSTPHVTDESVLAGATA